LRYQVTASFEADWQRLSPLEQSQFLEVVREQFHPACERYREDPATGWPGGLRVKRIAGAPGVWEMTWSFAGPDGRATFEWLVIDGDLAVRWRRIGRHDVLGRS
jgi:hypothetical protein